MSSGSFSPKSQEDASWVRKEPEEGREAHLLWTEGLGVAVHRQPAGPRLPSPGPWCCVSSAQTWKVWDKREPDLLHPSTQFWPKLNGRSSPAQAWLGGDRVPTPASCSPGR